MPSFISRRFVLQPGLWFCNFVLYYIISSVFSDLWLWVGADSRPRAWPHWIPHRVRGHSLVPCSRDHAQFQGKYSSVHMIRLLNTSPCVYVGICVICSSLSLFLSVFVRATQSPLIFGQWVASWLRCCPIGPFSQESTIWTNSIIYLVRQCSCTFLSSLPEQKFAFPMIFFLLLRGRGGNCATIYHPKYLEF